MSDRYEESLAIAREKVLDQLHLIKELKKGVLGADQKQQLQSMVAIKVLDEFLSEPFMKQVRERLVQLSNIAIKLSQN